MYWVPTDDVTAETSVPCVLSHPHAIKYCANFLKPDTIQLIPAGGHSDVNYSKKAMMRLVYREQLDGCRIMNGRNGREYRLPALTRLSVDGFKETNTVYEFCGCYCHAHMSTVP